MTSCGWSDAGFSWTRPSRPATTSFDTPFVAAAFMAARADGSLVFPFESTRVCSFAPKFFSGRMLLVILCAASGMASMPQPIRIWPPWFRSQWPFARESAMYW
ncbi:hypothetical protein GCM10023321_70200 [Pseudonocardia eucalypti]|uniref:Uncharacterized protein n=1 Tax=Pseudonocardia eucalypti TaxID=648755 RepID=A0ABP9R464_9PSEU